MGNTTSEYEAVHGLLKDRPGVEQKPSDGDKSVVGCVPTHMVGSGNAFLSDRTVQMINAIKSRASANGNFFSATHQSSSLQKSRNFKYHTRTMRQFLSNWSINDLFALVEEYENLNTLKSFVLLSNKARQYASTCRNDLANLIDNKLLADVQLVYEIFTPDGQKVQMGPPIQCHKAILAARSEYFRQLFLRYETTNSFYISSQVDPNVSYEMFIHFIRYLYSNTHDPKVLSTYYLNFLLSKFKCTRNFKEALNYLRFSDCQFSDSVLLFKSSNPTQQDVPVPLIYQCHKSVLCARSKFFSNYLKRKTLHKETDSSTSNVQSLQSLQNASDTLTKGGGGGDSKEFNGATQIVLDTEIVNPKYGRILMDSLYLDTIDLRNITNISTGGSAASETDDSQTIKSSGVITDAMDLYVIAGLLDIPVLAQGCEDIILRRLSEETVIKIITWASESHGSNFVFRQCIQFLTDEFASFSQSEYFLQISQEVLTEVLQSDYVQASELQILKAVIRWGQHQVETKDFSESCPTDEYSSTSQTSNCYEPNASNSSQVMYSRSVSYGDSHAHRVINSTETGTHPRHSVDVRASSSCSAGGASSVSGGPGDRDRSKANWRQRLHNGHRRRLSLGASERNSCSTSSVDSEASRQDRLLMHVCGSLLKLVRVAHIIPKTSNTYTSALKKKLIAVPYSYDAPSNLHQSLENGCCGWIRSVNSGDYTRPRLFIPYFNEAKVALADRLASGLSYEQLRFLKDYRSRVQSAIPDNLYMVDPRQRNHSLTRTRSCPSVAHQPPPNQQAPSQQQQVLNAAGSGGGPNSSNNPNAKLSSLVPIPEQDVLRRMIAREHELQNTPEVKQALTQTTINKLAVQREIQKSVVREFGYPDEVIEVLQNPLDYYNLDNLQFLAEDALENAASAIGFTQITPPTISAAATVSETGGVKASKKGSNRPSSEIDPKVERIGCPKRAVDLCMLSSAFGIAGDSYDKIEQCGQLFSKNYSRTMPTYPRPGIRDELLTTRLESERHREQQQLRRNTSNVSSSNQPPMHIEPQRVTTRELPCDLIPTTESCTSSQLPFADILQDINVIPSSSNTNPAPVPATSFRRPKISCSNSIHELSTFINNPLPSRPPSSKSQIPTSVLNLERPTDIQPRQQKVHQPAEASRAPAIPPRIPLKKGGKNSDSPGGLDNASSRSEFRCLKHLNPNDPQNLENGKARSPTSPLQQPPPLPPRNSLMVPSTIGLDTTYSGESVGLTSPSVESRASRDLPPDLTLPSSVNVRSWLSATSYVDPSRITPDPAGFAN